MLLVVDDLIRAHAEDKRILCAHFLHDLHVGAVHGAKGQRTVEHQLHVAGAGCLLAGGGNLLTHVSCCKNDLRVGNPVVLDEYHLDLSVDGSIVVDHIRHGIDELDGQLCPAIACCRFGTEDKCSRVEIHLRVCLDLVVQIHHV